MYFKALLSFMLVFVLCSCDGERPGPKQSVGKKEGKKEGAARPIGEDVVLAVVNGSEITRYDLDLAIRKLAGEDAAAGLDEKAARKVLESLVLSRAISQLQQKELTAAEQDQIAGEVAAFEEQLLVRRYLAKHGKPQPVTMEAIQEYYNAHPDLFGARKIRQYEMITTGRPLQAKERDELLGKLKDPETHEKWQSWVDELAGAGYPAVYRKDSQASQGREGNDSLHPQLAQAIAALTVGQVSKLILVKETPYLVRITSERDVPARPLAEVSDTVRKALAPRQLKQSIEQVGKEVLAKAAVEYKTTPTQDQTPAGKHP